MSQKGKEWGTWLKVYRIPGGLLLAVEDMEVLYWLYMTWRSSIGYRRPGDRLFSIEDL